jgi:DNA-binding beta-propeller fold protein YncE
MLKTTIIAGFFVITLGALAQTQAPLQLEKEIPLGNVQGRIDHLSADADAQRLFVSALGNGTVEVVDLKQGQVVHEIPGLKEPQGVLYDANSHRLFVASDGDGTLRSFDAKTFAPLTTAELGDDADNVRYDGQNTQILVGYGSGGLAAFDPDLRKLWDVKLPSHPESFQLEQHGSRIFVNLPKSVSVDTINRQQKKISGTWHTATSTSNYPMALDEAGKRLFLGFRNPARLLVFNSDNGSVVASLPTVGDTDDLFYDSARHTIYVIGGEGAVDVFLQRDTDHYERISRISTSAGARTGLFVPALARLFVAAPRRGGQAARILVYRVR